MVDDDEGAGATSSPIDLIIETKIPPVTGVIAVFIVARIQLIAVPWYFSLWHSLGVGLSSISSPFHSNISIPRSFCLPSMRVFGSGPAHFPLDGA